MRACPRRIWRAVKAHPSQRGSISIPADAGLSGSEVRGDGASFRDDGMDRAQAQEAGLAALTAVTESSVTTTDSAPGWVSACSLTGSARIFRPSVRACTTDGWAWLLPPAAWAAVDGEHADEAAAAADAAVGPLLELLHQGSRVTWCAWRMRMGWASAVSAGCCVDLAFLGGMSDDDEFAEASATLIRGVPTSLLRDDNQLDLMSGAAGLIAPLVPLVLTQTDGDAERLPALPPRCCATDSTRTPVVGAPSWLPPCSRVWPTVPAESLSPLPRRHSCWTTLR